MSVGNRTVTHLHVSPQHRATPQSMSEVRAVVGAGIAGDFHSQKPNGREVLVVDLGVLEAVGLKPGALREQITVNFPGIDQLPVGIGLRIGQVTFEVSGPCEPCMQIGKIVGVADPAAFKATLAGRRGILARVVAIEGEGKIRAGDAVDVLDASDARSE